MSGRRNTDSGYVEFTTPYFSELSAEPSSSDLWELAKQRAILIPIKKIITFAPFDVELHEWFKEKGLVKIIFNVDEASK